MENQHRKITGYRDLNEDEITLMNHCKDMAGQVGDLVNMIDTDPNTDERCVALAKTYLQTGFMWLVRAVAKPETF